MLKLKAVRGYSLRKRFCTGYANRSAISVCLKLDNIRYAVQRLFSCVKKGVLFRIVPRAKTLEMYLQ
jgi:hypothetical protein